MSKVLVIDDDPVVRLLMSECLTMSGYEVQTAENGSGGLQMLQGPSPDIIFVDLIMPDMTGLEFLTQLRANPALQKLPVVLLSADADRTMTNSTQAAKPDRILQKPWNLKNLLETLAELTAGTSEKTAT